MTLLVILAVSLYTGVGLLSGAVMARRAYHRGSSFNRDSRCRQAAWWSFFLWPGLLVFAAFATVTLGAVRLAHRIMLPEEVR